MTREELLVEIRKHYLSDRLESIDKDYLEYEENMAKIEDLERILKLLNELRN